MKVTFQLPDELYQKVKVTAAMEGRTLRDLTIGLFEQWLWDRKSPAVSRPMTITMLMKNTLQAARQQ